MFNKIYKSTGDNDSISKVSLAFLKSTAVKAFPSGRRRSEEIDKDGDKYYIPFDPEARLNTEANARKYSSLNGYTQTYLKEWDKGSDVEGKIKNGRILLSLEGYLFDIELSSFKTPAEFGTKIADELAVITSNSIYANILLEDVQLYSSTSSGEYYTSVLRDQLNAENDDSSSDAYSPSLSLDLLNSAISNNQAGYHDYVSNINNYYFSGLSFSAEPLAPLKDGEVFHISKNSNKTVSRIIGKDANGEGITSEVNQQVISLRILEKAADGTWQIYQPAYLPRIEHDTTDDSIVVYGDTTLKGTDKHFKAEGTAEVQGDTLLKSNLTVKGTTEVDGNTAIHSNLSVDDNINVGSPVTPATEDNGGYIVAQKNITAEQNLVAKNDLRVDKNAEIVKNLTVKGTITAEEELADGINNLEIRQANIDTLTGTNVTYTNITVDNTFTAKGLNGVETDRVKVGEDTIVNTKLVVNNDVDVLSNKITTKDLTSTDTILANNIGTSTSKVAKITVKDADIETLNADDIQQKVGDDYCDVPVMFLKQTGPEVYQLQISRVNKLKPVVVSSTRIYSTVNAGMFYSEFTNLLRIDDYKDDYKIDNGLYLSIENEPCRYYVDPACQTPLTDPIYIKAGSSVTIYHALGEQEEALAETISLDHACNTVRFAAIGGPVLNFKLVLLDFN